MIRNKNGYNYSMDICLLDSICYSDYESPLVISVGLSVSKGSSRYVKVLAEWTIHWYDWKYLGSVHSGHQEHHRGT